MSLIVLWMAAMLGAAPSARAFDIYVDSDAPGGNNGSTWLNAYRTLHDALAIAQPGDTVKVAQGVYRPDEGAGMTPGDRFAMFELRSNIALMGGYAGYSALPTWQWDTRNTELYETVLSGDLQGNDLPFDVNDSRAHRLRISASQRQDNSYTVVMLDTTQPGTLLEGVTIKGGNANSQDQSADHTTRGGGVFCKDGSPTIRNCRIEMCTALGVGGGMYNLSSAPKVDGCTFLGNYSEKSGSGMYNLTSDPNIINCLFESNNGNFMAKGAGIYNDKSDPNISHCVFKKNKGVGSGGGLYNSASKPNVTDTQFIENRPLLSGGGVKNARGSRASYVRCKFIRNHVGNTGGAASNDSSDAEFLLCEFIDNDSADDGGAIHNRRAAVTILNCLFNANAARDYGGAIACYNAEVVVTNCTFSGNVADSGRALACTSFSTDESSQVTIVNSILWDSGIEITRTDDSSIDLSYSITSRQYPGTHVSRTNPSFENPRGEDRIAGNEDDNFRLSANSPAIDSGTNIAVPLRLVKDLLGVLRRIDDPDTQDSGRGTAPIVDRGAYEFGDLANVTPPIADAGPDQSLSSPTSSVVDVMLDGSASGDPDGDSLQYEWTWAVGNQAYQATGVTPTIQLPAGQHAVTLVVFDGIFYSAPDGVLISIVEVGNRPIADAGPDQSVISSAGGQASVHLNGSGSFDTDGDPLQYAWSWVVNNQTIQTAGFAPTIQLPVGQYTVRLVVFDGTYYSAVDTVQITVTHANRVPVADAGPDQTVTASAGGLAAVALDGFGSSDPDGDSLQYTWSWTVGNQSYQTTLVTPTIQLPIGQHQISLVVFDGQFQSSADIVQVTVIETDHTPVANAGADQTVTASAQGLATVTLNGSGSFDQDGDPLQYLWRWTVNNQTLSTSGVAPTIQLPVGQHTIELLVFDGTQNSTPDTVVMTVMSAGNRPIANAGPDQTVASPFGGLVAVTLNGSGSFDPDGDPLQYTWSWATNNQPFQAVGVSPVIQLPVGQHLVTLFVSDGVSFSLADTVLITVQLSANRPVAHAGPDQIVTAPFSGQAAVQLNGSGSFDPDGDPLQYAWKWTINNQIYQTAGVTPTLQLPGGQHVIELTVFDGTLTSLPDTVTITVQSGGSLPIANAGPDQTVRGSPSGLATVFLDGSGSFDPAGRPLEYTWRWTMNNQLFQVAGVRPVIQLPVGQHFIELVVDNAFFLSWPDVVTITVTSAGNRPVADAGSDQDLFIAPGELASVNLNGSASADPDGDLLQYTWSWRIGGLDFQATGVSPTVQFPVGHHVVSLTVFDGTTHSNADEVIVFVRELTAGRLWLWPFHVTRSDAVDYVLGMLKLNNVQPRDVDLTLPARLLPADIPALAMHALLDADGVTTTLFVFFDEEALLRAIPQNGQLPITVVGQLRSGQPFFGSATLFLTH